MSVVYLEPSVRSGSMRHVGAQASTSSYSLRYRAGGSLFFREGVNGDYSV